MATKKKELCPVCANDVDLIPWKGDLSRFEICDYCGIQFGYTDSAGRNKIFRNKI